MPLLNALKHNGFVLLIDLFLFQVNQYQVLSTHLPAILYLTVKRTVLQIEMLTLNRLELFLQLGSVNYRQEIALMEYRH